MTMVVIDETYNTRHKNNHCNKLKGKVTAMSSWKECKKTCLASMLKKTGPSGHANEKQ